MVEETETQLLEYRATPVHFTLEHLGLFLLTQDPARDRQLVSFLREKYHGLKFDLVITIGEQALVFAERHRAKLFPEVPLLFFVVNPVDGRAWLNPRVGRTGVIRKLNYVPTLQVALQQNPGTRQVIVVSGTSDVEKLEMKVAREQFRAYEANIDFQYWTDLSLAQTKFRLTQVEPGSVILFLDLIADAEGEQFTPSRILPVLAGATNRPIYGTYLSFVGNGVVGGQVADLREVGQILGRDGARILRGDRADIIPVVTGEFQHYVFDWRQLQHWSFPNDQLPPGSSVLFWQFSPWELYRWRILALSVAVVIEALLILLLLHSRIRRRRAEGSLRRKETELSEAQRLAQMGSWQWDPKTDAIKVSSAFCSLINFNPELPLPPFAQLSQLFSLESWQRLTGSMDNALQTGATFELEVEVLRPEGASLWAIVRGEVVRDADDCVVEVRGTIQNITERKRSEEARLKHSAIVESSDDAIVSENLNGIITSWNSGAQRIFGFSEAEAVGQPITIIIPPELQDEENMILRRVQADECIEHYETVRLSKERKQIDVSLTISPVRDSTGRVVGASKIARDMTEQKQRAEELRESEEKFSKAFRQGPTAMSLTDVKTRAYIDVNETFECFSGYRREELVGRSAQEAEIWADPSERVTLTDRLLADGSLRDVEFEFRTKDGRTRLAQASAELIEVKGDPCILWAAIDITDRKHAELALLESEKRFRLMADSAPVLMWLADPDRHCTDFNKEWLRFTGRSMQQEIGEGWTHSIHPDNLKARLDACTRAFDAQESFAIEYRLRRHDGEYRWMLDRGVPRFLEDGSFAGYIGCCVDITDQKKAKAVQAELSGRLIQAQEEERARIAGELHDDINQRLALVANGLQSILQISAENDENSLEQQIRALHQLTSEIATDIQHISHQLHPSKLHYLGLTPAIRSLCQEFSKQHKIQVECTFRDLPGDLDESVSLSLFRTVQESLRNVAKHSHARHAKVEMIAQPTEIRLHVSDDGVGFDPERVQSGHGLGLVSMQERLKSVGGELSVWSRPSLGTQVEATVPRPARQVQSA